LPIVSLVQASEFRCCSCTFSPATCFRTLRLGIDEFEDVLCAALQKLPFLEACAQLGAKLLRHKARPLLAARLRLKKALMQKELEVKLITIVLFAATADFAQTAESRMPVTDADRIADGLRAGPAFVTKDAMLLNWPSIPGGEFRVLRKGSSQWTCLPAKFARNSGTCFAHTVTPLAGAGGRALHGMPE
jgi:hypothetical protein